MRWDTLFADLETQLEAAAGEKLDAEVAERTRLEFAATTLEGRLRAAAAAGRVVELSVVGAGSVAGVARRVGAGWMMLDVPGALPAIVATQFIIGARDLPPSAREEAPGRPPSPRELGLVHVLRVLARDRTPTAIVLATGVTFAGTVDRVGTDYLDLAEHFLDEPRRTSVIRGIRTVSVAVIAVLRPRLA